MGSLNDDDTAPVTFAALIVFVVLLGCKGGASTPAQCSGYEESFGLKGATLSYEVESSFKWKTCSDNRARELRCRLKTGKYECDCHRGDSLDKTFDLADKLPANEKDARTLANASCGWKLSP